MKCVGTGWLAVTLVLLAGCISSTPQLGNKDAEAAASYNLQLGIDYFRQGNLSQAKEKLDRSLQQNSKSAPAYVASALLYDRLGETRKATQYFDRAINLDPKNGESLNTYAVFLCRKGDFAKGEKLALESANNPLYKSPEAAFYNAGNCAVDAGRDKDAEIFYRRALSLRPNFAAALLQMADLEFRSGNFLPARAFLERFQQSAKPTAASLWLLVRVERALGNGSLAADYARRLQQDFPTSVEVKAMLQSQNK